MVRKSASACCCTRVIGCSPPGASPRPGRVTSIASAASLASSSRARIASRCDWITDSTRAFAWLMAAPAVGRSSAESFPSPLRSSVSEPDFPRKRAFACSRSATLAVAVMARSASATMWSSSFIKNKRGSCEPLVLFASLSGPEARFGLFDDAAERRLVEDREISEDLAIDVDRRLLQSRHELAVRDSRVARAGVDARDPEGAELALLVAAVAVGVLPRLHHRLLGDAIDVLAPAAEPLGLVEDLLVARARRDSAFYAWHGGSLGVGKHRLHVAPVGLVDAGASAQVTLVLRGSLGEDVALAGLVALDRAARANPKALGRATLGLHLGHDALRSLVQQVAEPFRASRPAVTFFKLPARRRAATCCPLQRSPRCSTSYVLSMLLFGTDDHDHLSPFHLRPLLHRADHGEVGLDALEQL